MNQQPGEDWSIERQKLLYDIHNGIWSEKLLEGPFEYVFNVVLTPTERHIVHGKISGFVDGELAIKNKCSLGTVKRHIYNIRSKYRNQIDVRVDNHPVLRKRKGFNVRKLR